MTGIGETSPRELGEAELEQVTGGTSTMLMLDDDRCGTRVPGRVVSAVVVDFSVRAGV